MLTCSEETVLTGIHILLTLKCTNDCDHCFLHCGPTREPAMLIREHPISIVYGGTTYVVWVCGEERVDGTWQGWLEFHPTDSTLPILTTEQETSQPNRFALEYWADGLEPVYLEGALARAQGRLL